MSKQIPYNSREFSCGAIWNDGRGNTLTIIKTNEYYDIHPKKDFNVVYMNQNGVEGMCGYRSFKENCTYVEHMRWRVK